MQCIPAVILLTAVVDIDAKATLLRKTNLQNIDQIQIET